MVKMKNLLIKIALGVFIGIAAVTVVGAYYILKDSTYTIILDRKAIQSAIDDRLPIKKQYLAVFTAEIERANVLLVDGSDRIGIDVAMGIRVKITDEKDLLSGNVVADTDIRYDPITATIYLVRPSVDQMKIGGVPEAYTQKVGKIISIALDELVTEVPVYTITDETLKKRLAKALVKDVRVLNGRVYITLGF